VAGFAPMPGVTTPQTHYAKQLAVSTLGQYM
jgi:hypothetical protein